MDTDSIREQTVKIRAMMHGISIDLGEADVGFSLSQANRILPRLARFFGHGQQNLIYAASPAACEDVAEGLMDLSRETTPDVQVAMARADFAALLREQFHREYLLADLIEAGVAFHYGDMPATIRKGIESLFSRGHLEYLVCTSTLLHGVNFPAKNLFLHNPTKGKEKRGLADEPINSVEFWNLVGRAGRLKKDFEGNVFLLDERHWQARPQDGNNRQPVMPALFINLLERSEALLEFMQNESHASGNMQDIENTFVKLFNDYRANRIDTAFESLPSELPHSIKVAIMEALRSIATRVEVPREVCERNINVSVVRQQEMLKYLTERIHDAGPERVIPIHPSRYWSEVHANVLGILRRIHLHFEKKSSADRSHLYFAPLAGRWMRGDSYAELIEDSYVFAAKKRKRGTPSIAT